MSPIKRTSGPRNLKKRKSKRSLEYQQKVPSLKFLAQISSLHQKKLRTAKKRANKTSQIRFQ